MVLRTAVQVQVQAFRTAAQAIAEVYLMVVDLHTAVDLHMEVVTVAAHRTVVVAAMVVEVTADVADTYC